MVTQNPRINVTLDESLHEILSSFARVGKKSMSLAAKEMIEIGLSLEEDRYFSKLSENRLKSSKKRYSHDEAWK